MKNVSKTNRNIYINFRLLKRRWFVWSKTRSGKIVTSGFRYFIILAVLGYLIYQITTIGWIELWYALPGEPLFYLLLAGIYLNLPLIETAIYRHAWKLPYLKILPAIQQKRVYNSEVAGYSGEIYLLMWARKNTGLAESSVWRSIKDNTIVSSMATTSFAVTLLVYFLVAGELNLLDSDATSWAVVGVAVITGIISSLIILRKRIFYLPGRSLAVIGGFHLIRILAVNTMQLLQWMVILPEVSLSVWITYLSVKIMISWLPMLPAKDMFFLGASFELSRAMNVPAADVAGMLLVASALNKIMNTATFTWFSIAGDKSKTNKVFPVGK
ncbi:MAG: hypothetical protein ACNA8K_08850 [Cyclonatronaceae bacterium]